MQIYVTHYRAQDCPGTLDDRRLKSAVLNACVCLSAATHRHVSDDRRIPPATHRNHPWCRWAGDGNANYAWVLDYFKASLEQFHRRFGRRHSLDDMPQLFEHWWFSIPHKPLAPFPNTAYCERQPIDFRHLDVPYSYRNYLNARWQTTKPTWTRVPPPDWRKA